MISFKALFLSSLLGSVITVPAAVLAQQSHGDWIVVNDSTSAANQCSALTFALGGEKIMFALMGTKQVQLPGFEDKGPHVFFILRRGSPYPTSDNLAMRVSVDSAATFDFGAEIVGGAVHSTIAYDADAVTNFIQYASAGSTMTVEPGKGFYPIMFSLRGSSRALAEFTDCMSRL